MSTVSTTLCCFTIAFVSPVLFQSTEAVPTPHDRDRTILTFNAATDQCKELHAFSHQEEKDSADWACWKAFDALDEINENSCNNWRKAKCRSISGYLFRQCSCVISVWNDLGVRGDATKSFRDCAVGLWTDELLVGRLMPSDKFLRASNRFDMEMSVARFLRYLANISSSRAGTPHTGTPGAGTSGAGTSGAGTSGAGISGAGILGADTSGAGLSCAGASGIQAVRFRPVQLEGSASQPEAGALNTSSAVNMEGVEPQFPSQVHVCETCGKAYSNLNSYFQHMKSHTTRNTRCHICNKTYSTRTNYNTHMKTQHPNEKLSVPAPSRPKVFVCDVCGHEYRNASLLRDHRKSHTEILICKICLISYSAKSLFDRHIKNEHPRYEEVAARISATEVINMYNAANPFVCDVCQARFKSEKSQKQHMASHTSQSTTCTSCNRIFSTVSSYNYHMRTQHKGPTPGSDKHKSNKDPPRKKRKDPPQD